MINLGRARQPLLHDFEQVQDPLLHAHTRKLISMNEAQVHVEVHVQVHAQVHLQVKVQVQVKVQAPVQAPLPLVAAEHKLSSVRSWVLVHIVLCLGVYKYASCWS